MDKNSIIGLSIIGLLIVGYTIYTQPSKEQIQALKEQRDSIAAAEASARAISAAVSYADSSMKSNLDSADSSEVQALEKKTEDFVEDRKSVV